MYLCKQLKILKKVPVKLHILHLKNARAFGVLRKALDPVQHLLTMLTQLHSAMLAKSWKIFSEPLNSRSVMASSIQSFASYFGDETIQSPLNY